MILLAYILLGGSALLIIYDDIREQAIPVWELVIFAVAGLINQYAQPNLEGLMAFGLIAVLIVACQGAFYVFKRTPGLGSGDLVLISLSGLWLYLHEVPIFLFFTGLFGFGIGLMNKHYRGTPTFPMAPAIFLSFGVTLAISLIFPPF